MKIFGSSSINDLFSGTDGAFSRYLVRQAPTTPSFNIAGTDENIFRTPPNNRSIIAQGIFDYVVYSDNSGQTIDQSAVPGGRVIGYRVQHVTKDIVYSLTMAADTDARLDFYVLNNIEYPKTSINKSVNGGKTLTKQFGFTSENFYGFDMHWVDESTCYVVGATATRSDVGLRRYLKKFSDLGIPLYVDYVRTTQQGNGTLVFDMFPAVYVSNDGGASFTNIATTFTGDLTNPDQIITAIAIDPNNPNIVFYGTENGKIYRSTAAGASPSLVASVGSIVNRIIFADGNSTILYAAIGGAFGKVLKSSSSGTNGTWTDITQNLRYRGSINDIMAPNANTALFVGSDYRYIYKTEDGGSTWEKIDSSIKVRNTPIIDIKSTIIQNGNSALYTAMSEDYIYIKTDPIKFDSASTISTSVVWITLYDPDKSNLIEYIAFDTVQAASLNTALVFLLSKNTQTNRYFVSIFEPSTGNKLLDSILPVDIGLPTDIFCRNQAELYVVTRTGSIIRGDVGSTAIVFTIETSGTSEELLCLNGGQIGTENVGTKLFACGNDGTILYKTYGDSDPVTWNTLTSPTDTGHGVENVLKIKALSDSNLFVLTYDETNNNSYVYESNNGGVTWGSPVNSMADSKYIDLSVYENSGNTIVSCLNSNEITIVVAVNTLGTWSSYNDIADPGTLAITQDKSTIVTTGAPSTSGYLLTVGKYGISITDYNSYIKVGPWPDSPLSLVCISGKGVGQTAYTYWVGGGTTFKVTNPTSEPVLLKSTDAGDNWQNVTSQVIIQEPTLGDFCLTSISEGEYSVIENYDRFYIYGSSDAVTFTKEDSTIYNKFVPYNNGSVPTDGIRKIQYVTDSIGYAVGDIFENVRPKSNAQDNIFINSIIKTVDGGNTWSRIKTPDRYNFRSLYFISSEIGFVAGGPQIDSPDNLVVASKIFKTTNGGTTWSEIFSLPSINSSNPLTIMDVFAIDSNIILVVTRDTVSSQGGVYRTTDGGTNWTLETSNFSAGLVSNTKFSFVNTTKGYVCGRLDPFGNPRLLKTTDAGNSWTAIATPFDSLTSNGIHTIYYIDENTGFIAADNKIYKSIDADSNTPTWTLVYTIQPPTGKNSTNAKINQIAFSNDKTLGIIVGFKGDSTDNEHFILKSTDIGDTWSTVDSEFNQVRLENYVTSQSKIQRGSALYTVAFIEKKTDLKDEGDPPPPPPPPPPSEDIKTCTDLRFISASYYNFENFAYKCTKIDANGNPIAPVYHPNVSNNIGLGKNIFGQLSNTSRLTLKNNLTYGAALGVNALGYSAYSNRDTAVGYGAMDTIEKSKENVAMGYKALSSNRADAISTVIPLKQQINTNTVGITSNGIYSSIDGGLNWINIPLTSSLPEVSFAPTESSQIVYTQTLSPSDNQTYILGNDKDLSGSISNTYIFKSSDGNKSFDLIHSSSLYTVTQLEYINSSILYGLDKENGYVIKTSNAGYGWQTGSIGSFAGNTVNTFKILSQNIGFLVGTYIWKFASGSTLNWVTSSYTGSNTLNSIDSVNALVWIAVGTSGSIYKTTNGGDSWSLVTQSLATSSLNIVKYTDNGNIIAAGDFGKIIYSDNVGETWKTGSYFTTESFTSYNYNSLQITPFSEYILTSESGSVISNNNGGIWTEYLPAQLDNLGIIQTSTNTTIPTTVGDYSKISSLFLRGNIDELDNVLSNDVQDNYVLENVSIGAYSTQQHENAWGMVGVGARTFKNTSAIDKVSSANNGEFTIGNYYDFIYNDPIDSALSVARPSNYGQVAIGRFSQAESINTAFNTSVGYGALYLSQESNNNTAIGFYSQHLNNNQRNTSVGVWALGINGKVGTLDQYETGINYPTSYGGGSDNIAVGHKALLNNINSIRANQINNAMNSIDASDSFRLGSRNIAIGNRSLINASGSTNIVSIGHQAVFSGNDLTDSVFIGAYVGSEYKTPEGTYYSSSIDNDWRSTQTVAVGSYAIQNHIGTDIVAIGANALRGTPSGSNPADDSSTSVTEKFTVLLAGIPNGVIYSQPDYKKMDAWKRPLYSKYKSDKFNILDTLGQLLLPPRTNASSFKFQDVKIINKDTAYGLFILNDKNTVLDPDSYYPRLLKASNITKYPENIIWDSVQHTDQSGNFIKSIKGNGNLGPAEYARLSAPDEDNIFILSGGTKYGVYKSADGGRTFTTALDARTGLTQGAAIKLYGIYFPSAQSGSVVGIIGDVNKSNTCAPVIGRTVDGGNSWSTYIVDSGSSGNNVTLASVWFDPTHTTGYACGAFGSVYKSVNGGVNWTKLIGASVSTDFVGSVYSGFSNALRDKSSVRMTDIYFINPSIGWAVGYSPNPRTGGAYLYRTTDGGSTWNKTEIKFRCGNRQASNVAPTKVRAMDANTVFVSTTYGMVFWSEDGGVTVNFNYSLPRTLDPGDASANGQCLSIGIQSIDAFMVEETRGNERTPNAASVSQSVAVGADIQVKQDFVENNVAVGYKVQFNATGSAIDSVQIGASATINSNYVNDTVAIGKDVLNKTKYSDKTTSIGKGSLFILAQNPAKPSFPGPVVDFGGEPKAAFSDSTINTVVGYQAGISLIMGDSNVFIGANAGIFDNPSVTTFGSNNINVGTNSPKYAFNSSNQIAIGNPLHNFAVLWGQAYAPQPWRTQSDIRDKADTGSFTLGLNFIRQIQPKQFKWDSRANYPSGSTPDGTYKQSGSSYGYIAQDIELAASAVGVSGSLFIVNTSGSYSGSSDPSGSDAFGLKLITPGMVDLVMVNAVKELDTTVTYLSASKYSTNIGNGSDTAYPVTHSLGTRDVIAMVHSNNTNLVVYPTMSIDSTNTMTVTFPTIAMTNQYRLVVMR